MATRRVLRLDDIPGSRAQRWREGGARSETGRSSRHRLDSAATVRRRCFRLCGGHTTPGIASPRGPSQTNGTSATCTETTRSIPAWREITVSRIPRIGRDVRPSSAHGASPPGTGDPRASQPSGQEPHLVSRPGGDSLVGRFIQHVAAGATVAAGQNRPAPATTHSRWRTIMTPRLLPHTVQPCIHCRQNPAGFWISHTSDQTARRPWCLSCCRDLDPACHHIKPFDIQYLQ